MSEAAGTGSVLVRLQEGSGTRPIFLMHALDGQVSCYMPLVSLFGPDQTFYGIASELECEPVGPLTIRTLASEQAELIRSVQPQGPYFLGGWSFGALLALEIAQTLRARGEQVGMVAAIDRQFGEERYLYPQAPGFIANPDFLFLTFVLQDKLTLEFFLRYQRLAEDERLMALLQECTATGILPQALNVLLARKLLRRQKAHFDAALAYRPDPQGLPVVYFLASDYVPVFGKQAPHQGYLNDLRPRANLRVFHGCNHWSILMRPHVEHVAQAYRKYHASYVDKSSRVKS